MTDTLNKLTDSRFWRNVIIAITILAAAIFTSWWLKEHNGADSVGSQEYPDRYTAGLAELETVNDLVTDFNDTITALRLDNARLEILKNQAEAKLSSQTTGYKEAKVKKDTTRQLKTCDSIIFETIPVYHDLVDSSRFYSRQVDSVQVTVIDLQGQGNAISSTLVKECNEDNQKLRKRVKRDRLIFGGIGAAIATAIAWLSQ